MIEYKDYVTMDYAVMKGVVHQTVRDWVTAGKIESVNIDGRLFVKLTNEEMKRSKE